MNSYRVCYPSRDDRLVELKLLIEIVQLKNIQLAKKRNRIFENRYSDIVDKEAINIGKNIRENEDYLSRLTESLKNLLLSY